MHEKTNIKEMPVYVVGLGVACSAQSGKRAVSYSRNCGLHVVNHSKDILL